jgi:hypothetical protein
MALFIGGAALALKLSPGGAEVPVTSIPLGATLTEVGGEVLGKTPLRVTVPPTGIALTAQLQGFDAETVTIPGDERREIVIQLKRNRAVIDLNGAPLTGGPPYRKEGLAPGRHTIHAALEGYRPVDLPLDLKPGEKRPIEIALESDAAPPSDVKRSAPAPVMTAPKPAASSPAPKPAASSEPVAARPAQPEPRPAPPPPRPAEKAPAAMGALTLNAFPFAMVEIDGKPIKTTPLINHPLETGSHTVKLKTEDGRERTLQVTIEAGQTVKQIIKFDSAS